MDMYTVELFVMTASMQNFSKAADAMSVTQSTLSQQIRRLESELGYPLFTRQKERIPSAGSPKYPLYHATKQSIVLLFIAC